MKWVRLIGLALIGVCVGWGWQSVAPRPALADSSYSLSLKMVNEDANT